MQIFGDTCVSVDWSICCTVSLTHNARWKCMQGLLLSRRQTHNEQPDPQEATLSSTYITTFVWTLGNVFYHQNVMPMVMELTKLVCVCVCAWQIEWEAQRMCVCVCVRMGVLWNLMTSPDTARDIITSHTHTHTQSHINKNLCVCVYVRYWGDSQLKRWVYRRGNSLQPSDSVASNISFLFLLHISPFLVSSFPPFSSFITVLMTPVSSNFSQWFCCQYSTNMYVLLYAWK